MNPALKGIIESVRTQYPKLPSELSKLPLDKYEEHTIQDLPLAKKAQWINMLCNSINRVEVDPNALVMLALLVRGQWNGEDPKIPVDSKFQERIAKVGLDTTKLNVLCGATYGQLPAIVKLDKQQPDAGLYTPPSYRNLWRGKITHNMEEPIVKFAIVLHEWGHKVQVKEPDKEIMDMSCKLQDVMKRLKPKSFFEDLLYANTPVEKQVRAFVSQSIVLHPNRAELEAINRAMDR
jgi:hypothetical protein